jgi:ubiquinone/menaquinone biosynthesis C-methylase UbiE
MTEQEVLNRAIDEELAAFLRCIDNYETAIREVSRACKPASALCCDAGTAPAVPMLPSRECFALGMLRGLMLLRCADRLSMQVGCF